MATDALGGLQGLLEELFQFENADLDFGIYRIMNHKRREIRTFVDKGLPRLVDDALKGGATDRQAAAAEQLRQATDRVKETFGEYAIDSKSELNESFHETPLGKEYLEARSRSGSAVDLEDLKATIFNHVYTFFSRYYEGGDFLSKRRYSRRHKYAVPYNGEEVFLHWANADQYYVKTGEHFSDYRYRSGGVHVRFELAAADTEQNNVKGERRFFVPRPKDAFYDAETNVLNIPFEYRPLTAKEQKTHGTRNQQEKIIEGATADLPARFAKQPEALAALEPTGELERHLRRYTRRNTSDFFVHKDLKGFLEGELDFYLKNEVLDVDDLEAWGPERSGSWFEVMRAVKSVGRGVVAFLAQIEDFQKRLFEKKKLVVSAEYCLTLDRVPEELYPEVAASDAQREEWKKLFHIHEIEESITEPGYSEPLTVEFLKANPFLVLDTKHFGDDFVDRLLASIEDLDEQTGGLLVESENFQALNLLQERYRKQIKCIYIDPPYNTGGDGFLYKDSYQHSSWLTMMQDRMDLGRETLSDSGAFFVSIDDDEVHNLRTLTNKVFQAENFIANVVWQKKYTRANDARYFSDNHDHILVAARMKESVEFNLIPRSEEQTAAYGNPDNHPKGMWKSTPLHAKSGTDTAFSYTFQNGVSWSPPPGTYPRFSVETLRRMDETNEIWFGKNGKSVPSRKSFLSEIKAGVTPTTLWSYDEVGHNHEASDELKSLFPSNPFANPKPTRLMKRMMELTTSAQESCVMDFFAGSGTSGHAVIDLNREDGGNRKYILVEMGEYFASVLKPRILKVIYSKDWKDGKPVSRQGISHTFKYMKLESYEDALNNIAFTDEAAGQEALALYGDDYLLRYMLDFETRGSASLLNVEKLRSPFRYTLRLRDGDAARETVVDLPETFAYLLGLRVRTRRAHHDGGRRYLVYRGTTPDRGEVVAVWRDTEGWDETDFDRDARFVEDNALAVNADEIFVNGDSFIPEARPLEAIFKKLMLADSAVG